MLSLSLLYKGSIRRMFSDRAIKPVQAPADPLGIPENDVQCVHVEVTLTDGAGIRHQRCLNNADPTERNGWLCNHHNYHVKDGQLVNVPISTRETRDMEVIENVIMTDKKAIEAGTRHKVVITPRVVIQYLEMKDHDPSGEVSIAHLVREAQELGLYEA